MNPLEKLREDVLCLLESSKWKEVKPSSPRASEYFVQAIGDMKRCLGNLDRMEMVESNTEDDRYAFVNPGNKFKVTPVDGAMDELKSLDGWQRRSIGVHAVDDAAIFMVESK